MIGEWDINSDFILNDGFQELLAIINGSENSSASMLFVCDKVDSGNRLSL